MLEECFFCDSSWITKVSSTYLFHILGGCSTVLMALSSKASIQMFVTIGLTGDPIAAPLVCSKNWPLKRKYVLTRQNSSNFRMLSGDQVVLLSSYVSCSSLLFIISMASATGMEV